MDDRDDMSGQRRWSGSRSAAAAVAAACAFGAGGASAQSGGDRVAAEAAFDDARRLMAQGKYAEACPKFAESNRLDPGIGVLLYLGDCFEKNGQTASAWAAFREALPLAKAAGQSERERAARERAAALEQRLVRLTIVVPGASEVPGLEVRRDGVRIGRALWGSAIPVDPGKRTVDAVAPGRKRWSMVVDMSERQPAVTVNVPSLEPEGAPAAAASAPITPVGPAQPTPSDVRDSAGGAWGTHRTAAVVVGGAGLAGITLGAIFGVKTISDWNAAEKGCKGGGETLVCADDESFDAGNRAKTSGTISTIGFVAGGALVAGGVALWLTAPTSRRNPALQVAPVIGHGLGGLAATGRFQ